MINWKVDPNEELPVAVIEDTEEGHGICELEGGGTASREELLKTAALIAVAPKLLKTCRKLLSLIENADANLYGGDVVTDALDVVRGAENK